MRSVTVDLDATLAQYEDMIKIDIIGDPLKGAKEFLEELHGLGCKIIIFTVRANCDVGYKAVENWLKQHNMKYDSIWTGNGKPNATAFIDDRGVSCRPQESDSAYHNALEMVKYILSKKKPRSAKSEN